MELSKDFTQSKIMGTEQVGKEEGWLQAQGVHQNR